MITAVILQGRQMIAVLKIENGGLNMKKVNDLEFSFQPVPAEFRNNFIQILAIMLGLTFFSASMWAGGTLGTGLTFASFLIIVLSGNLILGLYTGALAYIAARTGLSTHLLTCYAFGNRGSHLSSFMLAITQVGWFGVGIAMFALPVQKATGMNLYFLIIVSGILMTVTAIYGIKALAILATVAVPAIIILGSFSVFKATGTAGGVPALFEYQPPEMIGLAAALTICIGSFISAGTLTPDFVRFSRTAKSAVTATVIAFFLGNSLMFLFGAVGAIAFGEADISEVMFLQGLIIPAIIVLGLNIWTTNENALYASSLGFANITKKSRNLFVVINGSVATIAAMWLYNNFAGYLTLLGSTLPSIGAIILADFFILNKGKYKKYETMKFQNINWIAIVAWLVGAIGGNFAPGIPPINALLGSAIIYIIGMKLFPPTTNSTMDETVEVS